MFFEALGEHSVPSDGRYWDKRIVTHRGLEKYLSFLNLARDDISGKTILDVGAGASNFAREVIAEGIDATVVSLEPDYALDIKERRQRRLWSGRAILTAPENTVAGIAEGLPFTSQSFDLVVANHSVPYYLPANNLLQYQTRFLSILTGFDRVLKPGGEIRIYPIDVSGMLAEGPYEKTAYETFIKSTGYEYTCLGNFDIDNEVRYGQALLVLKKPQSL